MPYGIKSNEKDLVMKNIKITYMILALLFLSIAIYYTKINYSPKEMEISGIFKLFPKKIGDWEFKNDAAIDKAIVDYLKPKVFIFKKYQDNKGNEILVSIVYHENKRWGPHDVETCYKSQGWRLIKNGNMALEKQGLMNDSTRINEFVAEKDGYRELVMYWWFTEDGQQTGSRFIQMIYLIKSGLLNLRSGGGMIRISTPFQLTKKQEARKNLSKFAKTLIEMVGNQNPKLNKSDGF